MKRIFSIITAIVLSLAITTGCASPAAPEAPGARTNIVLLDGHFAELEILMQMAAMLIQEHTELSVTFQDQMMTVTGANATIEGHVDLFVSYDGTLLTTIMGYDPSDVPEGEVLFDWVAARAIEVNGLTLLGKFGFENTYALAVHQEFAQEHNLRTISDLVPHTPSLTFGAEHEFFDVEGTMRFIPFNAHYDIEWGNFHSMEMALKYTAMDSGHIDVTMVFSTDGLNKSFDLFVLEDDLAFFPEYHAAFQHRATLFDEFTETAPNLREVLSMLNGQIDNETMIDMNYAVDALGQSPEDVAREFLQSRGFIS
ncbi:MAG: glycine/betaine ABC transporter substrate-binding protein [Defluviitaleaceae bacterium]|nr:glycine/betaine ABC transporter substrate-binding protein [Defluviitaleaceae bacterium]